MMIKCPISETKQNVRGAYLACLVDGCFGQTPQRVLKRVTFGNLTSWSHSNNGSSRLSHSLLVVKSYVRSRRMVPKVPL
jgi:hypothetical protein